MKGYEYRIVTNGETCKAQKKRLWFWFDLTLYGSTREQAEREIYNDIAFEQKRCGPWVEVKK